mmetsp:Transcript_28767/g.92060  ORF Transcript_28767/g.92060 Transcript_28767/m.92060 type:complete len:111 (-) Transcript_28767:273-605(-)
MCPSCVATTNTQPTRNARDAHTLILCSSTQGDGNGGDAKAFEGLVDDEGVGSSGGDVSLAVAAAPAPREKSEVAPEPKLKPNKPPPNEEREPAPAPAPARAPRLAAACWA